MIKKILESKVLKDFMNHKYINLSIIGGSVLICILIILFLGKNGSKDKFDYELDEVSEVIFDREEPFDEVDEEDEIERPDKRENLKEAIQKNEDVVGWLYIPGTTIDWPVVQGPNNSYYLRRNENKEYAFEGCIFGDEDSKFYPFKELSKNIVLYGHNLDDNPEGKKFAQLVKFQDIEFAKKTPYIFFTTKDASLVYQIYAVFFTDIKFGYIQIWKEEKMQQAMAYSAKQRSQYIYDVDVLGKDKVITLSTCTYKYGPYGSAGQKNSRFVVQGKLLKDTDKLKERVDIKKNLSPKEPDLK